MAVLGKQLFDKTRLSRFGQYIRQNHDNGTPQDYEIVIDGFKAVKRTSNPEAFEYYEDFVFPESRILELVFYNGLSNNNDKYIFAFKEENLTAPPSNGLAGIDIDGQIKDKFQKVKKEWEFDRLKEENQALKEEVAELERELEKLEEEKEEMIQSQSPLKSILGEVGSSFVESFIRRNPQILANLPGGTALSGILEEDNNMRNTSELKSEPEVSFKSKSSSAGQIISEEDRNAIDFVRQLKSRFASDEFDHILELLELFAQDKTQINSVLETLKSNDYES